MLRESNVAAHFDLCGHYIEHTLQWGEYSQHLPRGRARVKTFVSIVEIRFLQ
jgi:hypothetical protein